MRDRPHQSAALDVGGSTVVRQVGSDGGVFFVLYAAPLSDFVSPLADAAAAKHHHRRADFCPRPAGHHLLGAFDRQATQKTIGGGGNDPVTPTRRSDQSGVAGA